MNLSELFIRRPVTTILVMTGILFFGISAYKRLPVSDLPTVDFPTITVNAALPGASPETMASAVATPLEKQFSTIAGIDNMTSSSSLGATSITIQFTLDRSIDAAAQDVQAMIAKTLKNLPPGIIPPSYQKTNPADQPIVYYGFTSDLMPISDLDEYAESFMAQRISMVPGVAQVNVYGSAKYAVRVQLDPSALAHRQLGIDEVANAINAQNVNLPTGVLNGPNKSYTVQANGQYMDAAGFRKLVVAYRNGSPVRLGDVGNVLDDIQNNKAAAWYSGTRGVILAIQRQPGTNTVAVADAVNVLMNQLQKQIPASINMTLMYDKSQSIRDSVADVKFTVVQSLVVVFCVIFLFLRNISATLIPSLSLPISVIGTFAVMYPLDYSLDNLSLMALTLAVGFVVDDAIVVLENIVRHMEMGKPPMRAAMDGASEVGFTVLSMTISLTAVFIPILFLGGIVGRLFHEFAVVIAVSILVSGFVSLTLTPMLSSRFLRPHGHNEKHGRFYNLTESGYDWALKRYERSLMWVMNHKVVTTVFSFGILIATVGLFVIIPKGFIPPVDTGQIFATTETAQGTSFDDMVTHQKQIAAIMQKDTNVAGFMSAVGGSSSNPATNQGRLFVGFKPMGHRLGVEDIIKELRPKFAKIPGIVVYMQNPPAIQIGGRAAKSLYQFTMQSSDIATLYPAANQLVDEVRKSPLMQDVTSDLMLGNPQASVEIDRDRAASLGVSAMQIENALYDAYGSGQVSTIYTPNNEYWVVMELEPQYQLDLSAMNLLYVRANNGTLVPLSAVAHVTQTAGAQSVNHSGQLPSVTLSFNLRPGVALGQATDVVQKAADRILPSAITTGFSGTAQAFQSTQAGMLRRCSASRFFVIDVVLGVLYESFIHPITILSGLPFAAFGALVALLIFHIDLNVYAFVGIILLVGLVEEERDHDDRLRARIGAQ